MTLHLSGIVISGDLSANNRMRLCESVASIGTTVFSFSKRRLVFPGSSIINRPRLGWSPYLGRDAGVRKCRLRQKTGIDFDDSVKRFPQGSGTLLYLSQAIRRWDRGSAVWSRTAIAAEPATSGLPDLGGSGGAAGSGCALGIDAGADSGACALSLAAARNLCCSASASFASFLAWRAALSSRRFVAVARAASSISSPLADPSRLIRVGKRRIALQ